MIYLMNTFNPHWEGGNFPEWTWPKRRIFHYMAKLLDGPLSLGIGGLRRIGKTTLLKQLVGHLSLSKASPRRICYFQFDRDLVIRDDKILERVLDTYVLDFLDDSLGRIREKTYVLLDEIQLIPRWSEIVKRYLDRDPAITFVVSGSSSLLLESELSESLAGRLDMIRLSSPDFRDHMTINGLEPPPVFRIDPGLRKIPTELVLYHGSNQARLTRAYLDYLRWGGFPQLKDLSDEDSRRRYVKEVVVEKILRYDLPARFGGENPVDLERLYEIYANEYAQLVEYNTLARDIGLSVGRLRRLTEALIAGYLVQYCFNYTRSKRKAGRTGKKVYLTTPSLAAYRYGPLDKFPEVLGRIVENDAYLRLREKDEGLSFWRVGRQEIDFMFHVGDLVFPVECKTGRIKSKDTRLLRSLAEKWGSPFSVLITTNTLDFSDLSLLKVPAFLL
ncbi:MAG: ATP-binding protein [Desulfobacterales bacterium]|nr:ATP-binding protein [Desulfobacterales bacterium]